ncbi:MAG: hypothetical protein LJE88_13940 [Deltaproteobacteria bacterium]|nr:hypothetical protein [Deltaproteobacteria bacterium]
MTSCKSIIRFLFVFVLLVPGACNKPERQQKLTYPPREMRTVERNEPKLEPPGGERKNYVPGEIMVTFYAGTSEKTIQEITRELHLETIRVVSKPDLYLMKILDGSSVENVLERLHNYKEVKYAEPNYMRTTK